MKVVFLDIDGVMNSHRYFQSDRYENGLGSSQIDPAAVALLDRLLAQTGAKVVISSSWRHIWPWQEVAEMFEVRGFKHSRDIIGQTPFLSDDGSRGGEVQEWLDLERERRTVSPEDEPTMSYVILDDTDEFHGEQRPRFVRTSAIAGLTEQDVAKAVQILEAE